MMRAKEVYSSIRTTASRSRPHSNGTAQLYFDQLRRRAAFHAFTELHLTIAQERTEAEARSHAKAAQAAPERPQTADVTFAPGENWSARKRWQRGHRGRIPGRCARLFRVLHAIEPSLFHDRGHSNLTNEQVSQRADGMHPNGIERALHDLDKLGVIRRETHPSAAGRQRRIFATEIVEPTRCNGG